jgi:hypothetical protein
MILALDDLTTLQLSVWRKNLVNLDNKFVVYFILIWENVDFFPTNFEPMIVGTLAPS